MAEIIIGDLAPRNQYTATAGQTIFPYTFPIFDQTVLVVQQTVALTGVTSTLTLTTDYTVSGVDAAGGGNVTLVSGAAVNDIITIERDVPVARATDFLNAGDFRAETVNREHDLEIMMMQQNERDIARAFKLQTADTSTDLLIPLKADRAGKYLTFDASGNPSAASGTGNDTALRTDLAAAGGAALVGNTPAGNIVATDVQAAIDELDTDKEPKLVNSAGLAAALSDETGTGLAVFNTSPTLVTPALGTPASGNLANCTGYPETGLINLGTPVATTSGTSHDFTGIPTGCKRITLMGSSVSTNGTGILIVQIGDAGGIETSGYISHAMRISTPASGTSTAGFSLNAVSAAASSYQFTVTLNLENAAAFRWSMMGNLDENNTNFSVSAGTKALSAELTQIRLTTVGGTDTFDAGEINIQYEV